MEDDTMLFISGLTLGFILGIAILGISYSVFEATAIEHNCAVYDAKTGAFTWKDADG